MSARLVTFPSSAFGMCNGAAMTKFLKVYLDKFRTAYINYILVWFENK